MFFRQHRGGIHGEFKGKNNNNKQTSIRPNESGVSVIEKTDSRNPC